MDEHKVKTMLNREVLEQINDYTTKNILKAILYSSSNNIDWEQVYTFIMAFMPELRLYDGYLPENMKSK